MLARFRFSITALIGSILLVPLAGNSSTCEQASNLASDENIELFHTSAYFDKSSQRWRLPLHIWVYEPEDSVARAALFEKVLEHKFDLHKTEENAHHFDARVNLLIADNERGKRLSIEIGEHCYTLPKSEPNGHIHHEILLPEDITSQTDAEGIFTYRVALPSQDPRQYEGQAQLRSNQGTMVISDIDDTVKQTHVINTATMLKSTFLEPFTPVTGMAELYQNLAAKGAQFHFVSSSPWQLYSPLLEMLESAQFPWADFSLKHVRFRDETLFNLFKEGMETKPPQIEAIIQRYPNREFILIGDSGEQDPEIYQLLYKQYPDQIRAIWIRALDNSPATQSRFQALNEEIAPMYIQLFSEPAELLSK